MKKELKICMPLYKIVYSLTFIFILSIIRGIAYIDEIGTAMEPAIAILAAVFCADIYLMERQGRRWEVFTLFELKSKVKAINRRLFIQILYLIGISTIGYGSFYIIQKPILIGDTSQVTNFAMFVIAISGTVLFWGTLAMTISNLAGNMWVGIGVTLLISLEQSSKAGDELWGKWNVFSYMFRKIDEFNNWEWMCGKTVSLVLCAVMIAAIPLILKKRG